MSATLALPPRPQYQLPPAAENSRQRPGWLESHGLVVQFDAEQEIYGEGAPAEYVFKVLRGCVRLCRFLPDGRRHIETFHETGEVFGIEIGALYRMTAEAVSDCALLRTRQGRMAAEDDAPAFQDYLMASMVRAEAHAILLGRRSAVEKLANFLLDLARRRGDRLVPLAMSRQDIADYLGLTIETVSRALSQLERDSVIARDTARTIRIADPASLRALAN
jgi:CRP/FNR family nitrogen fixation transcriptional regulator